MARLCTICARGGSKGVKNKNILRIGGKPLIAHSILQAKESGLFEYIAVSSDSDEILDISSKQGADFCVKRPLELADDHSAKLPAIKHAALEVEKLTGSEFTTFCDLDATSPLRISEDIIGAVSLLELTGRGNVITAMHSRRSPYFNMLEFTSDGGLTLSKPTNPKVVRRQDAPQTFDMNASIYVWSRVSFFQSVSIINDGTKMYLMPEARSFDIDTEFDFELVRYLMEVKR
ncbi:MAG: acylneuraminate cytidylyltransferase family protein [Proteobacteria bacterium]|nr:acylneuraminate cytidylyltransferase family protein [Pseudomonadota bacterium]